MNNVVRFPYTTWRTRPDDPHLRPVVPLLLSSRIKGIETQALVDSGSDANVLPQSIGIALGLRWSSFPHRQGIGGAILTGESRVVPLQIQIEGLPSVLLNFVWVEDDKPPLILGTASFFFEFDICFFRSRGYFEISPKQL